MTVEVGFVTGVTPAMTPIGSAIETRPLFANVPKFNQKLKKLCKKEKVIFIDNTDLVKQEYYADDGIHMSPSYYTKWVDHMAEAAGL